MLGIFRLADDESLVLEFEPPDTRYWNVTLENIWHECLEPRRRHSSVTNKGVEPDADGVVRIAIGGKDFGHGHWLDTGGRHRGFVVFRWLDNPEPPKVVGNGAQRRGGAVSAADRLTPPTLIEQACEWAGSDDFGTEFDENETWREGLGLFCEGLIRDARLNDLGVELAALDVVQPLKNRLQIVEWRKSHPEIARGEDQQADFHHRSAPHRDHNPFRSPRPGSAIASPADVGGRQPLSTAAAGDLRHRPADRRIAGPSGDERADHSRLHEVAPDGCAGRPGVRADLCRPVLQHDLHRSVPAARLLQVASVRSGSSAVLSISPNLPAALAVRGPWPMAAEVARAPVGARHPGRRIPRCGDRADTSRPAHRHLVDQRIGQSPTTDGLRRDNASPTARSSM